MTAAAVQIHGDGVLRQTPLRLVMEVAGCARVNNERREREHTAAIEGPAGKFVARTENVRQGEEILHGVFYRRHDWAAVRLPARSVITYHSLEDRIVKNMMKAGNAEGKIEQDFFGRIETPFKLVNNKVIVPDADEQERNPRSRSAKLRIAEKK